MLWARRCGRERRRGGSRSSMLARLRLFPVWARGAGVLARFSVMALAFVLYAQARGEAALAYRQAQDRNRADLEPEFLWQFASAQIAFGADPAMFPNSKLMGIGLADNLMDRSGNPGPGA